MTEKIRPVYRKAHNRLPIFLVKGDNSDILYTPGYFIKIKKIDFSHLSHLLDFPGHIINVSARAEIIHLLTKAGDVMKKWESQALKPFANKCLTIHTGNECNQDCSYCYSKKSRYKNNQISGFPRQEFIEAVFNYMAENSDKEDPQMTVVFHGSGEPTIHWQKICDTYQTVISAAEKYRIKIFTYLATNGCLDDTRIAWLARNIDVTGISCDGPPDISEMQRVRDRTKYFSIKKVCERLLNKGGRFIIRSTITLNSLTRQEEIARYLIQELHARELHFEPVYLAGRSGFKVADAETFFNNFKKAKDYAAENGAVLEYSGVRLNELHGPYCDVLRDTLRISSEGLSHNCFCNFSVSPEFITGYFNEKMSVFNIGSLIQALKAEASGIPDKCNDCINIYHCSRGCPDFCIYLQNKTNNKPDAFRCRLHQLIAVSTIRESAASLSPVSLSDV